MFESRQEDGSIDFGDNESIILPKPRRSFLKRASSLLGFDEASPRDSPRDSETNLLAQLTPADHGRAVSIESTMFDRMLSQTGLSKNTREARESWAEEKWLGKLLKRGDGFKRAPPELPRWKETHVLLTRKELVFVMRGQDVQIEDGVLYSTPGMSAVVVKYAGPQRAKGLPHLGLARLAETSVAEHDHRHFHDGSRHNFESPDPAHGHPDPWGGPGRHLVLAQ